MNENQTNQGTMVDETKVDVNVYEGWKKIIKTFFWTFIPSWYGLRNGFPYAVLAFAVFNAIAESVDVRWANIMIPGFWFTWYGVALLFDRMKERRETV